MFDLRRPLVREGERALVLAAVLRPGGPDGEDAALGGDVDGGAGAVALQGDAAPHGDHGVVLVHLVPQDHEVPCTGQETDECRIKSK